MRGGIVPELVTEDIAVRAMQELLHNYIEVAQAFPERIGEIDSRLWPVLKIYTLTNEEQK